MTSQWLTVQSFHQSQDLLAAINTLSIHLKLRLAGVPDEERAEAAAEARRTLRSFLHELETVVHALGQDARRPLLGIDPRLRQLGQSFVEAKRQPQRFRSALFRGAFSRVKHLLCSYSQQDQRELLQCLDELRLLLEQHIHADAMQILEEI